MTLNVNQHFVDRTDQRALFAAVLAGEVPERVILVLADGEEGKTCFLQRLHEDCLDNNVPVIKLDFDTRRSGLTDWLGVARQVRRDLKTKHTPRIDACDAEIRRAPQGVILAERFADAMGQAMLQDLAEYGGPASSPPPDIYTPYEIGIAKLLHRLHQTHAKYHEALAYQHRLLENVQRARLSGDTPERTAERTDIMVGLHIFTLNVLRISFDTLCQPDTSDTTTVCHQKVTPRLAVLVDTFEHANAETRAWLEHWLFEPLCDDLLHVAVVVAGRASCCEFFDAAQQWRGLIHHANFEPLSDTDIQTYYRLRQLSIPDHELPLVLDMARLSPGKMAHVGDMLFQSRGGAR